MALITTKTGDTGMTQLNPDRIASKSDPMIGVRGDLDELSCALGLSGDRFDDIQTFLSEIMGYTFYRVTNQTHIRGAIADLEEYITTHSNAIPTWFVNSRGAVGLARAVCRRAERGLVKFIEDERARDESERYMSLSDLAPILQYMNRLSDYLFVKSFEHVQAQPELFRDNLAVQLPFANVA